MNVLERLWAYVTLGATGSLWGEASPLLGGLAAQQRELNVWWVAGAVALGTWVGVQGFYVIGRWRGKWVRKRWPRARPIILRSVAIVRRHPWRASLGSRFAYGVRIALPIACGIGRVPFAKYAIGTAVSSVLWSAMFTGAGWFMGRAARGFLGHLRQVEAAMGVLIVVLVMVAFWAMRRGHVEERTVRALDQS